MTDAVRDFYARGGTATWLGYTELVTAIQRLTIALRCAARNHDGDEQALLALHTSVSMQAIVAYLAVYHAHEHKTRLVFWFTEACCELLTREMAIASTYPGNDRNDWYHARIFRLSLRLDCQQSTM